MAIQLQLEEDAIKALKDSDVSEREKLKSVFLQWKEKKNPPYALSILVQLLEAVDESDLAVQLGKSACQFQYTLTVFCVFLMILEVMVTHYSSLTN